MFAVGPDDQSAHRPRVFFQRRIGAVHEQRCAHRTQIAGGAKSDGRWLAFGRPVHPGAVRAIERHLFTVHGEEVLPEELTQVLKQIPEAADHGVIAPHGVRLLAHVYDIHDHNRDHGRTQCKHKQLRQDGDDGNSKVHEVLPTGQTERIATANGSNRPIADPEVTGSFQPLPFRRMERTRSTRRARLRVGLWVEP